MDTEELEMSSREKQQLEDERSRTPHDETKGETLRAVICVCRHGDRLVFIRWIRNRTPKQKLKFKVMSDSLLRKLEGVMKNPRKELKVKEASQMSHIVSVVTDQIHEMKAIPLDVETDGEDEADQDANRVLKTRLLQLVAVLQQGGQFRGFNRKIQIRPLSWEEVPHVDRVSTDEGLHSEGLNTTSSIMLTRHILENQIDSSFDGDEIHSSDSCSQTRMSIGSSQSRASSVSLIQQTPAVAISHTPAIPTSPFELRRGVEKVITHTSDYC